MTPNEVWHVQVDNRVYQAETNELIEWIAEGSVLPEDKVRKGDLRWLPAGRIPQLSRHFDITSPTGSNEPQLPGPNNFEFEVERNGVVDPVKQIAEEEPSTRTSNPSMAAETDSGPSAKSLRRCFVHKTRATRFVCNVCQKPFCGDCTNRFGNVRLCPDCSGMCVTYNEFETQGARTNGALNKPYARKQIAPNADVTGEWKLGLRDVFAGIAFALRPSVISFSQFALFVILTYGIGVCSLGGWISLSLSLASAIGLTVLMFTVLRAAKNSIESPAQAVAGSPIFKRLLTSLRLGVSVNLVSFGLFFLLLASAATYAWTQFSATLDATESLIRTEQAELNGHLPASVLSDHGRSVEQAVDEAKTKIIVSTFGGSILTENQEFRRLVVSISRLSVFLLTPIFLTLLIGIIYYPVANCLAFRNLSVRETISIGRGLKLIRSMGFEFVKVTGISLIFVLMTIGISIGAFWSVSMLSSETFAVVATIFSLGTSGFYTWKCFSYLLVLVGKNEWEKAGTPSLTR